MPQNNPQKWECSVYSIDPDSGNAQRIRTFTSTSPYEIELPSAGLGGRRIFNSDYTKVTAHLVKQSDPSGRLYNVGWIDQSGGFIDVSEVISPTGDFIGLNNHTSPKFDSEDNFYYLDRKTGSVMRIPQSDIKKEAENVAKVGMIGNYLIQQFNTVIDGNNYYYYDDTLESKAAGAFIEWMSKDTYLGLDSSQIGIYKAYTDQDKKSKRWIQTLASMLQEVIIPAVKGRTNENVVMSPDHSRFAFLSYTGDGDRDLYVCDLKSKNPVKLNTTIRFPQNKRGLAVKGDSIVNIVSWD